MSLLSQMKMFLGAGHHSIETIAARVARRGKVPAGKVVRKSGGCHVARR